MVLMGTFYVIELLAQEQSRLKEAQQHRKQSIKEFNDLLKLSTGEVDTLKSKHIAEQLHWQTKLEEALENITNVKGSSILLNLLI